MYGTLFDKVVKTRVESFSFPQPRRFCLLLCMSNNIKVKVRQSFVVFSNADNNITDQPKCLIFRN